MLFFWQISWCGQNREFTVNRNEKGCQLSISENLINYIWQKLKSFDLTKKNIINNLHRPYDPNNPFKPKMQTSPLKNKISVILVGTRIFFHGLALYNPA